jgi:hypothetical protein
VCAVGVGLSSLAAAGTMAFGGAALGGGPCTDAGDRPRCWRRRRMRRRAGGRTGVVVHARVADRESVIGRAGVVTAVGSVPSEGVLVNDEPKALVTTPAIAGVGVGGLGPGACAVDGADVAGPRFMVDLTGVVGLRAVISPTVGTVASAGVDLGLCAGATAACNGAGGGAVGPGTCADDRAAVVVLHPVGGAIGIMTGAAVVAFGVAVGSASVDLVILTPSAAATADSGRVSVPSAGAVEGTYAARVGRLPDIGRAASGADGISSNGVSIVAGTGRYSYIATGGA